MSHKKLTLKEFRELGLLQEINRHLLHPMGFAMGVEVPVDDQGNLKEDSTEEDFTIFVLDDREDLEGFAFGAYDPEGRIRKMKSVKQLFEAKRIHREEKLGWHVQPVEEK